MRSCVTFNMNTLIYTCVVFPLLTTQQFAMYVRILWLEQENLINNVLFLFFQDGKSGKSVIHYAAETGNTLLLDFLLQYSTINLHSRTYSGLTAIMLADGRNYHDIVHQLQKYGGSLENVAFDDSSDSEEDMVR